MLIDAFGEQCTFVRAPVGGMLQVPRRPVVAHGVPAVSQPAAFARKSLVESPLNSTHCPFELWQVTLNCAESHVDGAGVGDELPPHATRKTTRKTKRIGEDLFSIIVDEHGKCEP